MIPANPLHSPNDVSLTRSHRRRWMIIGIVILVVVGVLLYWNPFGWGGGAAAKKSDGARPIPVAAAPVTVQPLDHTVTELGTVTARATVTVRAQVDGQLTRVAFTEGQLVHAGDLLAQIDPRPFEAALANAKANLERDDAQLQGAIVDLERYRGLSAEDSIPKQQLDTQEALVRQLKGTVNSDRAQIQTAELNLIYSHITAPVSGRVGLRQVDAGNIVHAADTTGVVIITEVQPIDVIFPVPQDAVQDVVQRMGKGARLVADAYGRDGRTLLGSGKLASVDNLIDTTTGTVKLKAAFPNRELTLFPNQFVNIKLRLETIVDALTIPTAAVQRGAPGNYVYMVQADNTVTMRVPKLGITEGDRVQVLDGLAKDDKVVTDGTDKLREGAKVEVIDPNAQASAHPGATGKGAGKGNGDGKKKHQQE
jgi:multidrug efflux system membrane fusion protein